MFKMLILLIAVLVCGLFFLWSKNYYSGPKTDHFDGRYFHNIPDHDRSFKEFLKWIFTRQPTKWPEHRQIEKFPKPRTRSNDNEMIVTFVNHATVLVQWDGLNFLTDPVWSERASPFSWMGPKRVHEPGIAWDDLPTIDFVLLSHNHYDHMDKETLKKLVARDNPVIITGLGNGAILSGFGISNTTELDWWQNATLKPEWSVTYVPAKHFSARWPWDKNKALWGGFVVKSKNSTFYFAGDTGYGEHFAQIADRFGPFRLALIPIGAYEPKWFMQPAHVAPDQSVSIHKTLKANKSLAIHFGTFCLSDEGIDEPVKNLRQALQVADVSENDFWILKPGESRHIP